MDDEQLGWQDPADQLDVLRVAVRHLCEASLAPRERVTRATSPLTKYWRMPERLKNRRANILNARIAVQRGHFTGGPELVAIRPPRPCARWC